MKLPPLGFTYSLARVHRPQHLRTAAKSPLSPFYKGGISCTQFLILTVLLHYPSWKRGARGDLQVEKRPLHCDTVPRGRGVSYAKSLRTAFDGLSRYQWLFLDCGFTLPQRFRSNPTMFGNINHHGVGPLVLLFKKDGCSPLRAAEAIVCPRLF